MNALVWINSDKDSITNSSFVNIYDDDFVIDVNNASPAQVIYLFPTLLDKKTIFIRDLGDARVSLLEALPISIECWSKRITVYSPDIGEFAFGDDEVDAIDDFKSSVVDLYFLLKDEQNNLGPLPLRHWNFLRTIIQEN